MQEFCWGLFVGTTISGFSMFILGASLESDILTERYRLQLIERDYGEYCSKTGKFAFIGECDVK